VPRIAAELILDFVGVGELAPQETA
jgi:hypothetical protein